MLWRVRLALKYGTQEMADKELERFYDYMHSGSEGG